MSAYFSRVQLPTRPSADEGGLRQLHRAQSTSIPFENFDVLLGRPIALDDESLERKLVRARRGGYCFELNGLMLAVLDQLGFTARPLLARVFYGLAEGTPVPPRTHQLSLVELPSGPWITDVGFGGATLREPIPLAEAEHEQGPDRYRLARDADHGWMLHGWIAEHWHRLYGFTLDHVHDSDRVMSNHYTSTHPKSAFRAGPRAARILPRARIAIWDKRLRRYEDGRFVEQALPRGAELLRLLESELEIELDQAPEWS